jgi:excisionase family DNA binding protein
MPDSITTTEPLSVTPREAQRLLGISNSLFYGLVKKGELETYHVGRKCLVRFASLKRFANGATS